MNSYMNITVRMTTARAQREIDFLRKKVASLEAQLATTSATASRAFGNSAVALSKWGSQLQWAGRQLTANFTAPLVLAGGFVTKWVLDNEAGMVRIQKVYGDAATGAQNFAADVNALGEAFTLLSTKYATQRADVLAIAGDWAAAGATGGALARGVEATLQTMVLGEMEAAEATEALIAIQAQYGASTERLIEIVGILNATENETGITFGGLVQGMSRSASAARSAGVDVDHLAAMLASISPAAGSAGQAGNALKTIFSRLLGPTRETREVMGAMGIDIDDLAWKSLNGAERLERLADAYMHLEGAGEGMISSQAGVVSALVASRWQINRFDVLMRDLAYHIDENSDTNGYYTKTLGYLADKSAVAQGAQKELNAVLESSPYAMKRVGVVIQNSLMKVISLVLPQILWMADAIGKAVEAFTNLDPSLQKIILGFLAFLAVLGPPLVLMGSMAVAIGQIGRMFSTAATGMRNFGGAIKKLFTFKKATDAASAAGSATQATAAQTAAAQEITAMNQVLTTARTVEAQKAQAAHAGTVARATATMTYVSNEVAANARVVGSEIAKNAALVAAQQAYYSAKFAAQIGAHRAEVAINNAHYIHLLAMYVAFARAHVTGSFQLGMASSQAFNAGQIAGMKQLGAAPVLRQITASAPAVVTASAATGTAAGRAAGTGFGAGIMLTLKSAMSKLGAVIMVALRALPALLVRLGGIIAVAFTGPWGWAIAAVLTILWLFKDQIAQLFKNIWSAIEEPVTNGWNWIVDTWNKGVEAVMNAMRAMPEGIAGALRAVVGMIRDAALAVYEWFSYINPFARHSPSLVENVTNGMRVVGNQFGLAADVIKRHMMNAYSSLKMFGSATKTFMNQYNKMIEAQERSTIRTNAGEQAAKGYDALRAVLKPLYNDLEQISGAIETQGAKVAVYEGRLQAAQDAAAGAQQKFDQMSNALSSLGAELDEAKARLDGFSSAPIEGMRAMSDAIFENEMAQKRLRLEMMQLGDVDISDLQNQLASLQGEIETLRGEQSSLQQAGAGSDILSAYDDQISALEAQQGAINDSVAPLNQMQEQLEQLQRAGEILDLENSIQFDPLQRQVDQLSQSYNELPFDEIMAGVTEQKAAVDELQAAYDAANKTVEDQQAVLDSANAKVDQAQIAYDGQRKVLEGLQTAYDAVAEQIREIESAIDDVVNAAKEMESALEAAKSAGGSGGGSERMTPGLENFLGAAGGSFPDVGDAFTIDDEDFGIDAWLDEFMQGTGDLFGSVDIWAPFKDAWNGFKEWWSTTVTPFFSGIGSWFSEKWSGVTSWAGGMWEGIKSSASTGWETFKGIFTEDIDWTAPFQKVADWFNSTPLGQMIGPWFEAMGDPVSEFWANLKASWDEGVAKISESTQGLRDSLSEAWTAIKERATELREKLSEAWETIKTKLSELWEVIRPKLELLRDKLGALWDKFKEAWEKIKPVFQVIGTVIGVVIGIIAALIGGIIMVVTNVLANVIGPIVDAIVVVIETVIGVITGIVTFITGVFTGDWQMAWDGIKEIFGSIWEGIGGILTAAWDFIVGVVTGIAEGVSDWFQWMWDVVGEKVTGIYNDVTGWFKDLWDTVVEFVKGMITGVIQWFSDMWTSVTNWVSDLYNSVKDFFSDMWTAVVNKVREIVESVVEWFSGLPEKARNAIGNVTTFVKQKGKDLINGLWNGVKDIWENVTSWFGDIGTKVKNAIGNMTTLLKDAGKNIITGLWNGLTSKWEEVKGWFGGIGSWIQDNKGPKAYDLGLLVPAGNWIMTGLQSGLKEQIPNLKRTLNGVADTIFDSMDGVRNVTVQSLSTDAAGLATRVAAGNYGPPTVASTQNNKTVNFYGDLSFPNISDPDDADKFLQNLVDLTGTGEG